MKSKLVLSDEERIVVDIVNPEHRIEAIGGKIIENSPLDFIISNKLLLLLYEKLDLIKGKQDVFKSSKEIVEMMQREKEKAGCMIEEAAKISKLFKDNNIDFMIFKTIRPLQREFTDVDMLIINESDIEKADNILKKLGYIIREIEKSGGLYFKGLYVKIENCKLMTMHLHGKIWWEGIEINKKRLWEHKREGKINGIKVYVPSYEDDLVIYAAHSLYENHQLTLYDVLYIDLLLKMNLHIDYIMSAANEDMMRIQFLRFINIVNMIYGLLYGKNITSPLISKECFKTPKIIKIQLPFFILPNISPLKHLKYSIKNYYKHKLNENVRNLLSYFINPVTSLLGHKKNLTVCFFGIDGSGKSMHAEALEKSLEENGIRCFRIWARWRSTITYPVRVLIYVLAGYRRKDYHKSRILKSNFAYLMILDSLFLYLFKIKYPLLMGKIVICDRYIYDLIADLMHLGLYNERAMEILLKLIPEPDIIFWLDLPEEIALSRKDDTLEQVHKLRSKSALEYLKTQRENYSRIARKFDIPPVDTTDDFNEVHNRIFREVFYTYIKK